MRKLNIVPGHRITWWVYAGDERIRYQSTMRGQWGYDATCECGWDSRTGGGVERWVTELVNEHKSEARRTDAGYALIDSMRGDEHNMIESTCRGVTASFTHRSCTKCNPHHEFHTYKVDCAAALALLEPCTYCDSPGAWDASAIYRRNS
jgi:hypothetical protein